MASPDRTELVRLMAIMATGDYAALFPFIREFGNDLARTVRRTLVGLNRPDVARKPEDVDYLVQSAAFVIHARAAAWHADGALPWAWAERAIRAEVVQWLRHPAVEWDVNVHHDGRAHSASSGTSLRAASDLTELAGEHAELELLVEALGRVASERDGAVHLEYQTQKALGDRSPANTVGEMFELSPANVRQIDRRVRRRLSDLVAGDPTFGLLARLSWVEAC